MAATTLCDACACARLCCHGDGEVTGESSEVVRFTLGSTEAV